MHQGDSKVKTKLNYFLLLVKDLICKVILISLQFYFQYVKHAENFLCCHQLFPRVFTTSHKVLISVRGRNTRVIHQLRDRKQGDTLLR